MIRGSIYAFSDPNEAFYTISTGSKVIVVSEDIPIDPRDPNVIQGSCLMPPPMAMIAMIDGDAERFYEEYSEYLLRGTCRWTGHHHLPRTDCDICRPEC